MSNKKGSLKKASFFYVLYLVTATAATAAASVAVCSDNSAAVTAEDNEGNYYYPKAFVFTKEIAKASHSGYPPSDLTGEAESDVLRLLTSVIML